jgi:hypothetical protein
MISSSMQFRNVKILGRELRGSTWIEQESQKEFNAHGLRTAVVKQRRADPLRSYPRESPSSAQSASKK